MKDWLARAGAIELRLNEHKPQGESEGEGTALTASVHRSQ